MEGVKTAGMVQGTPDWQLDLMYESETDRLWAEQQDQPKANPLEKFDFDALNEAHANLHVPLLDCKSIVKYIGEAIEAIPGTPEADKLASIADQISDLSADINDIYKRLYGLMFPIEVVSA